MSSEDTLGENWVVKNSNWNTVGGYAAFKKVCDAGLISRLISQFRLANFF